MTSLEASVIRHHSIAGTYNLRDISGYATENGLITRNGMLFRSDKLDKLTQLGINALRKLRIRSVIDLRYTPEVSESADVIASFPEFGYRHLPLYELSGQGQLPTIPNSACDLYLNVIDHRQEQIRVIFSQLTSPNALPALVHCTAGKDRTGVVIALLLGALGVPHETIVADYALSAVYLDTLLAELRQKAVDNGWDTNWYERLLSCDPANMCQMLSHIDYKYGGIHLYLLGAGVTMEQLDILRDRLLDKRL